MSPASRYPVDDLKPYLRKHAWRHYNFNKSTSSTANLCELAAGRQVGNTGSFAVNTTAAPFLVLQTTTGIDQVNEVRETPANWNDITSINPNFSWWDCRQYVRCFMGPGVSGVGANATATQYTGLEMVSISAVVPPFPTPPTSMSGQDAFIALVARMTDGAWFLLVDDQVTFTINALSGVDPLPLTVLSSAGAGCLAEILYDPIVKTITARVNNKIGLVLPVNAPFGTNIPHNGAGVFVTSGTNGAGKGLGAFSDLYVETELP